LVDLFESYDDARTGEHKKKMNQYVFNFYSGH